MTTDPPPTRPSQVAVDPAQLAEMEARIRRELRAEMANQVRLASLRPQYAPRVEPAPSSALGRAVRNHPWATILGALTALMVAASPVILAAIDVARIRSDYAAVVAARAAEAEALQAYKARVGVWQDEATPKLRTLQEDVAKLRTELAELRARVDKPTKRR